MIDIILDFYNTTNIIQETVNNIEKKVDYKRKKKEKLNIENIRIND